MNDFNETKNRTLQKCIPALSAVTQASKIDLLVDLRLSDDDLKVELETKLSALTQSNDALVRFAQ